MEDLVSCRKWACDKVGCEFATDEENAWDRHVNNSCELPCAQMPVLTPRPSAAASSIASNDDLSSGAEEGGTAYVCPKCGRLCPDARSVDRHMAVCGQPENRAAREFEPTSGGSSGCDSEDPGVSRRTYRCQICHERFHWHGNLTHHLEEAHNIVKKRCNGSTSKATWHCDKCNYMAMYESELERHKRLHKNIKPFKCIFCDYNSSWKSDLKRHYEGHHKDRLGDEKSLNSIMNCYQNNAGTQMEVQTSPGAMDKTRLPVLLLSQPSSEQTAETSNPTPKPASTTPPPPQQQQQQQQQEQPPPPPPPPPPPAEPVKVLPPSTEPSLASPPALKLGLSPSCFACKLCDFVGSSEWLLKQHALIQHQHNQTNAVLGGVSIGVNGLVSSGINGVVSSGVNGVAQPIPSEAKPPPPPPPPTLPQLLSETYLKPPLMSTFAAGILPQALQAYLKDDRPTFSPAALSVFPAIPSTIASMVPIMSIMKNMPPLPLYPTAHAAALPPLTPSGPAEAVSPTELERLSSNGEESACSMRARVRARGPNKSANERNYRRFKCSQCSHRSNWKWDINKHIKVAHPGAANARLIVLTEEEAMATLQQYLSESGGKKRSGKDREGYYRPFQCSHCGKRSNWEWDINNHIKKAHDSQGFVVKLTHEEAIQTIEAYMNSKKHPSEIAASRDPSFRGSPRKDALNLKRFKCNDCGYRSNYRSDIKRHINRKHTNEGNLVILTEEEARDSLKAYVDNFPQRSNALFKKSIPPGLLGERHGAESSAVFSEDGGRSSVGDGGPEGMDVSGDGSDEVPDAITAATLIAANRTRLWACGFCETAFRSLNKPDVFKHIQAAHPNCKPFVCTICRYGSDYRNSLIRHIRTKHREVLDVSSPTAFCTTFVLHLREDTATATTVAAAAAAAAAAIETAASKSPESPQEEPTDLVLRPPVLSVPFEEFAIDYSLPKGRCEDTAATAEVADEEAAAWRSVKYKYDILLRRPARRPRREPRAPPQPLKVSRCPRCSFGTKSRGRFLRHLQHHRRLRRLAKTAQRTARQWSVAPPAHAAVAPTLTGYRCAICPFVAPDSEGYIQHVARHSRVGSC